LATHPPPAPVPPNHYGARNEGPANSPPSYDAWQRLIEELLTGNDLWHGYEGLSAEQILTTHNVAKEIKLLQLHGVSNAHEIILRFGAPRTRQVRVWAEKKSRDQRINSIGGLVVGTLFKGPPSNGRK